jgi:hypothetical protein
MYMHKRGERERKRETEMWNNALSLLHTNRREELVNIFSFFFPVNNQQTHAKKCIDHDTKKSEREKSSAKREDWRR